METLNKSWNSRRWPGTRAVLTASSFNEYPAEEASVLRSIWPRTREAKGRPREIVAAEGLAVGLAVSPYQGETAD